MLAGDAAPGRYQTARRAPLLLQRKRLDSGSSDSSSTYQTARRAPVLLQRKRPTLEGSSSSGSGGGGSDTPVRFDLRANVGGALPQHLLFYHLPKAFGTSLRELVADLSASRGMTMQSAYDVELHSLPPFNRSSPAQVIFGHHVDFTFHRRLPPGASYAYIAAVREPVSWALSMFLHYFADTVDVSSARLGAEVRAWLNSSLARCALLRRHPQPGDDAASCQGQLRFWHPFEPSGVAHPTAHAGGSCARVVRRWIDAGPLLLVAERFDASAALLARLFGRSNAPARLPKRNARPRATYDSARLSFGDAAAIAETVSSTCLQDIYAAGRDAFDADLLRVM